MKRPASLHIFKHVFNVPNLQLILPTGLNELQIDAFTEVSIDIR